MKNTLWVLAFLATSLLSVPTNAAETVFTNRTIQAMISGGVPVATIVRSIRTAKQIDLYINDHEYTLLKNAGASKADADEIMKAINAREWNGVDNSPEPAPVAFAAPAATGAPAAPVQPVVHVSAFRASATPDQQAVPATAPAPAKAPVQPVPVPVTVASVDPVPVPVPVRQPVQQAAPAAAAPVVPAMPVPASVLPASAPATAASATIRPGSKIYIEADHGFESFVAAAFIKKHVPVVVTDNKTEAEYTLVNTVIAKDESGLGKLARCAYALCIGIDGTQTATVELMDARREIIWAYNVRKGGSSNYQSSAEAIAKHMKEITR